jgi:type I restriction enzyme S subunit
MSDTPPGWEKAIIEDLVILNPKHRNILPETEVSFVAMAAVSEATGEIENSQSRRFSEVSKGYTHFQTGDVIFAKITPCMENGKIAVARKLINDIACGSTEFHVLRPRDGISADYLWRFLRQKSFRVDAERAMTGVVGQRRVPPEYLKNSRVPLPPCSEQQRIAMKIDSLFAKSKRARDNLDHIPRLVEKYKQELLTSELVVSKGEQQTLDDLTVREAPIRYGVIQPGRMKDEGVLLIRVCDLLNGRVLWPNLRRISPKIDEQYAKARVIANDILISVVGTIGRVALVDSPPEPVNIARALARLRPDHEKVLPQWLCWRLQARDLQYLLLTAAREVARKTLNIGLIREMKLLVPTIEEQHLAVQKVSRAFAWIDRLASEATTARKLIDHLDQAILAKAFRGELVAQDPNDEPAGVLLDRILSERPAAEPRSHHKKVRRTR